MPVLHFPTGRRLDDPATRGLFLPELGWRRGATADVRLIGFLPAPVELRSVIRRLQEIADVQELAPGRSVAVRRTSDGPPITVADGHALTAGREPFCLSGLDPATARRLVRARGRIMVEARLPGRAGALEHLQALFQTAAAATAAGPDRASAIVWYDTGSERWLEDRRLRLLADAPAPPGIAELFSIQRRDGGPRRPRLWLRTRGLARAGIPDLEMFAIAPRGAGIAGRVLHGIAGHLLDDGAPLPGQRLPVARDVGLTVAPIDVVLAVLPRGTVGTRRRDRVALSDTELRAAVIGSRGTRAAARGGPALDRLLRAAETGNRLVRPVGESRRMQLLAQQSLPFLLRLWRQRRPGWMLAVELARPAPPGGIAEHAWFEPIEMDASGLRARRLSATGLDVGSSTALHPWSELTDWYAHDGDCRYGPLEGAQGAESGP